MASRAAYIIICNGRINLRAARDPLGRIQAASNCAAALVTYYGERCSQEDTQPISDLQHAMMDMVNGDSMPAGKHHPDEMVDEMFALLEQLEDRMEG